MTNNASVKNVPVQIDENVLVGEVGHSIVRRNYISECKIIEIAYEKYKSSGKGITIQDVIERFAVKKTQAQRSLKHFHTKGIVFTAEDLINQGIDLVRNTSPQQYFPACIKADIIQDVKKQKECTSSTHGGQPRKKAYFKYSRTSESAIIPPSTNAAFVPLYMHKLQLMLSIDKQYYNELAQNEGRINRAKRHEEIIGRRHVAYTFSPNGTVGVAVKSSDTLFKLETEEDEALLFSFLGQVRDRLLYCINDIKERAIPPVTEWILKECDLNKDSNYQNDGSDGKYAMGSERGSGSSIANGASNDQSAECKTAGGTSPITVSCSNTGTATATNSGGIIGK